MKIELGPCHFDFGANAFSILSVTNKQEIQAFKPFVSSYVSQRLFNGECCLSMWPSPYHQINSLIFSSFHRIRYF